MSGVVAGIVIVTGCCVVLPIAVVSMVMRYKTHEANKRAEIVLAALEKNPGVNVEEVMHSMSATRKSVKERLFQRLTYGLVCLAVGLGMLGYMAIQTLESGWNDNMGSLVLGGCIALAVGLAFIIAFLMGKRMFAHELETEGQRANLD